MFVILRVAAGDLPDRMSSQDTQGSTPEIGLFSAACVREHSQDPTIFLFT